MSKSNIIDLNKRRKSLKSKEEDKPTMVVQDPASVTDISEMRSEIINEERRKVKRTILTEFIGANVVVPAYGLMKVSLYDISEGGCAFDMDMNSGKFKVGEEVAFRVYMNHKTYFSFLVRITHIKSVEEEGVYRHGCRFMEDTINREALGHFVRFIESVSASLKSDHGDVIVSNIK